VQRIEEVPPALSLLSWLNNEVEIILIVSFLMMMV
jgi:hypothetical protein